MGNRKILILCLLILHIVPVWFFKYFPSQDGPSHIYNAYVLKALLYNQPSFLQECFTLNLAPFPNWLSPVVLVGLLHVVPALIAEKILLTIIIVLFPLSLFYFLNAVHSGKSVYGFFGFPFSYNYLLHMGFYNFVISVPLYFFALGYFLKHRDSMRAGTVLVFNCLGFVIFFCHIVTYCLFMLSITLLLCVGWYARPKQIMRFCAFMLPLYCALGVYLMTSATGQEHVSWSTIKLLWFLMNLKVLVCFSDAQQIIPRLLLGLVGGLFLATIYDRLRSKVFFKTENQYLMLFCLLVAVYFIAPWKIGQGSLINERVSLFIVPVLLPFFKEDVSYFIKRKILIALVSLSIAHVVFNSCYYYYLNKGLEEFVSGSRFVERNRAVLAISSDWWSHEVYVRHVEPFVQAVDYYCIDNDGVNLGNYEAKFNYFPINWKKKYTGIIHYIVAWKFFDVGYMATDDVDKTHHYNIKAIVKSIRRDYDLVYISDDKNLKLYRHKSLQNASVL